ncbi:hypothetical protein HELRODRAFT_189295 [Helobdella robusta]|uniref:C2H2-type domain-containing protein n=1 Tax=Helobdella robusta TaxID=6412 RepID=T1FQX5_HELRO|nr:hypothetical protein HELRODRAFT_189295 [Helobdella robusta]ESN96578.1 hypothetical protein HELRODRAFT_189295 [Helobdella robusta]
MTPSSHSFQNNFYCACQKVNLKRILIDTVSLLCQNGLTYRQNLKIEGVIGVTVDDVVFLVHIDQAVTSHHNSGGVSDCYAGEKDHKLSVGPIRPIINPSTSTPEKQDKDVSIANDNDYNKDHHIMKTPIKTESDCFMEINECSDSLRIAANKNSSSPTLACLAIPPLHAAATNKTSPKSFSLKKVSPKKQVKKLSFQDNNHDFNGWLGSGVYNSTNNSDGNSYFNDGLDPQPFFENQSYQDIGNGDNTYFPLLDTQQERNSSFSQDKKDKKLKSHQCQYPDCGRVFNRKDSLVRHQRTLHGKQWGVDSQLMYFCSECPRKFYRTSSLSRHLNETHGHPKL